MILTGSEIKRQIWKGNIFIEGFDEARLGPNSYNLRLAPELKVYKDPPLDPRLDNRTETFIIPKEGFTLLPGRVYIARTMEYTATSKFVPMLEGRSSVGRLGISVHVTAGFGDVGFQGNWTLELTAEQPVVILPGIEICQIYYLKPKGKIMKLYRGKYQVQRDAVPSRMFWVIGGGRR